MATIERPLSAPGDEAAERGRALRAGTPRSSHSAWTPPADRPDPLATIARTNAGRIPALVPLRNARMAASAYAFYRGSADVMAADLARTPTTGLTVQLCGDAHPLNFGFGVWPGRRPIFDVNDFDETTVGPWEWDLKRLAAGLVLAIRSLKLKDGATMTAVLAALQSYRRHLLEYASSPVLATWLARVDVGAPIAGRPEAPVLERLTVGTKSGRRFRDAPPLLYHTTDPEAGAFDVAAVLDDYASRLAADARVLFDRYRLIDHAVRVVGVGSVGTRCAVALLWAGGDDAFVLQLKEALAPLLGPPDPPVAGAHAARVVLGRRRMQAVRDPFWEWGTVGGRDYYVRAYGEKKTVLDALTFDGFEPRRYAELCGWSLAHAHARSANVGQIAAYLGRADTFDKALVRFGMLYADQAEQDFAAFRAAIDAGSIPIAPPNAR